MENHQQVTPQDQPIMQAPQTPHKSNLLVMVIGGIVLLGLGLLGGYFLFGNKAQTASITSNTNIPVSQTTQNQVSPTMMQESTPSNDSTVNWKTYTSKDNRYTFKYPASPGWESSPIDTPDGMGNAARIFCNVREQEATCKQYTVHDFEVAPTIYKSLEEYKSKAAGISDIQTTTINGEPAVKAAYAGSAQAGGSAIHYFVVHNGIGYQISYWFDILNINKLSQFPNPTPDIIPSFKFLN